MSAGLGAECLGLRVSPTLPSSVPVHVSRQGAPLDDRGNRPPGSSARFGSLNTYGQYLGNSVAAILSYRCQLAFVVGGPRRVDILSRGSQRMLLVLRYCREKCHCPFFLLQCWHPYDMARPRPAPRLPGGLG